MPDADFPTEQPTAEETAKAKPDAEISAMSSIKRTLDKLTPAQRLRVVGWAHARFCHEDQEGL